MLAAGTQARSEVPSTIELSPIWHPSPNFGERRDGLTPSLIVIHYTAMDSAQAALERLCDPKAEVSAHYLIGNDGTLWQMVREEDRAWHAGAGEWDGKDDINSRSIGIELDNTGLHPFSEPQMTTLETLLPRIMNTWSISASGVIGHSDMAPGRKSDPGPHFDWQRLERQALAKPRGSDVPSAPPSLMAFRAAARRAGFTAPVEDTQLLAAVRLRFRPWAKGPLETADLNALTQPNTIT
ncbi:MULTISPECIES: N-acetylmuramoyl-L-alanine amidase [unclassified Ruegeria]|uniref:N-acetylmuramoyl-L-alanine amidase n=1 Tax=unclassified Ruegeria TaxID=2625375 RepID=UPI001488117F|nr:MULTISPECIES: N-acetylmuramoyl-L-alanine amidase [unclassified Ruegeria]NOD74636.1 N-acetylmuramoyl-L-alanine amidase [Ruegeria sp. HKCCD4332]NOD88630.1 N-acetylmuramoyl-L-alanine amidase [Ruegeria sp. HKCCD4318]NOE12142.1 N-acetylmuramoyl-L-alanine amidase [Ruegeria sp. HKCCD4318-2]NOG09693.1 N-acetylmuramoyl-L-alanine amidase [Ruegeria sp. HKCCD4315]